MAAPAICVPVAALMPVLKVAVFDMLTGVLFVLTLALVLTALRSSATRSICAGSMSSRSRRNSFTMVISSRRTARYAPRPQRGRTDRMADRGAGAKVDGVGYGRINWNCGAPRPWALSCQSTSLR
jgi:hypothetical protein